MRGLEPPLVHELHSKVLVRDTHAVVPRDAPFVIWTDPVDLTHGDELYLIWTYESEARHYCKTAENRPLVGPLPVEGRMLLARFPGLD